jgi:hypothetical protein
MAWMDATICTRPDISRAFVRDVVLAVTSTHPNGFAGSSRTFGNCGRIAAGTGGGGGLAPG